MYSKYGRWAHRIRGVDAVDYEPLNIEIYASDLTGNLTPDPLRLDIITDNMAPITTATTLS